LKIISKELLGDIELDLIFKSGFPTGFDLNPESLIAYYADKQEYDLKLQRTTAGVHRADIKINFNGKPAHESASRGQLKLLAITLLLAQSNAINTSRSVKGILLIDDLAAELDEKNKNKLLEYISKLEQQIIITSTKKIGVEDFKGKMFHVKHGEIEEVHPPTF
jgi:DNA replication and repair protein RecF